MPTVSGERSGDVRDRSSEAQTTHADLEMPSTLRAMTEGAESRPGRKRAPVAPTPRTWRGSGTSGSANVGRGGTVGILCGGVFDAAQQSEGDNGEDQHGEQ